MYLKLLNTVHIFIFDLWPKNEGTTLNFQYKNRFFGETLKSSKGEKVRKPHPQHFIVPPPIPLSQNKTIIFG